MHSCSPLCSIVGTRANMPALVLFSAARMRSSIYRLGCSKRAGHIRRAANSYNHWGLSCSREPHRCQFVDFYRTQLRVSRAAPSRASEFTSEAMCSICLVTMWMTSLQVPLLFRRSCQTGTEANGASICAVEKPARLVVVELKRTTDDRSADLQPLRHAAMVAQITFGEAVAPTAGISHSENARTTQAITCQSF